MARKRQEPVRGMRVTVERVTCAGLECMAAALEGPVLTLGPGAWRDVLQERGSPEDAMRWLAELATRHERVIAANLPGADGASTTVLIAPQGWTQERLDALGAELEPLLAEAFGAILGVSAGDVVLST